MAWNHAQQVALAIVPKFTALLSLSGSTWILMEVLSGTNPQDNKPKRTHPYHRLLLAMSAYDILESVFNFASTWAIPAGTDGVFQPRGTTASCSAQGFFLMLSIAVPIYNAFLSLYYVLVVNYRMTDDMLKRKVEPYMHLTAFLWAFGTASVSGFKKMYNNANLWCWIAPYPAGCIESVPFGQKGTCTRGDYSKIFRWVFYFGPLWFCIAFAGVCTIIMCSHVATLDKRTLGFRRPERSSIKQNGSSSFSISQGLDSARHVQRGGEICEGSDEEETQRAIFLIRWYREWKQYANDNPRTVQVQVQALYYLGVFLLTHVWSTTNRIMQQTTGNTVFGMVLIHSAFDPLQGFLNFLVYQRPRYLRVRKNMPALGRVGALLKSLRFSCLEENVKSKTRSSKILQKWSGDDPEQCPRAISRISTTCAEGRTLEYILEGSSSEDDGDAMNLESIQESSLLTLSVASTLVKEKSLNETSLEHSGGFIMAAFGDVSSSDNSDMDSIDEVLVDTTAKGAQCERGGPLASNPGNLRAVPNCTAVNDATESKSEGMLKEATKAENVANAKLCVQCPGSDKARASPSEDRKTTGGLKEQFEQQVVSLEDSRKDNIDELLGAASRKLIGRAANAPSSDLAVWSGSLESI